MTDAIVKLPALGSLGIEAVFGLAVFAAGEGLLLSVDHWLLPNVIPYAPFREMLVAATTGLLRGLLKAWIGSMKERLGSAWETYRKMTALSVRGETNPVTGHEWDSYYERAREIDLMGHGMNALLAKGNGTRALKQALDRGAAVRMLLLDPESAHAAEVAHQLLAGHDLIDKIKKSLAAAEVLRREIHPKGRLDLRVTSDVVYSRICRFDNTIVATLYSNSDEPGDLGITLIIEKTAPFEELFRFFMAEFERVWTNAEEYRGGTQVAPPAGRKVFALYDNGKRARDLLALGQGTQPLPLPAMAIVYPTYKCSLECDYCAYKGNHQDTSSMSFELWKFLLTDLCKNGIKNVEFSGGGEPLETPGIAKFLATLSGYCDQGMQFGLLTNGLHVDKHMSALLGSFAYVRLSYGDAIALNPGRNERFLGNLRRIVEAKQQSGLTTRIGVKLLLTKRLLKERDQLVAMLRSVGGLSIDLLKIQSASGEQAPLSSDLLTLHADLDQLARRFSHINEIQIDIERFVIHAGHRCWLGASVVTIDPHGHAYPCINYNNLDNYSQYRVGDFGPNGGTSIRDIWKVSEVQNSLTHYSPCVCRDPSSVNCRFARYQRKLSQVMNFEDTVNMTKRKAPIVTLPGFY